MLCLVASNIFFLSFSDDSDGAILYRGLSSEVRVSIFLTSPNGVLRCAFDDASRGGLVAPVLAPWCFQLCHFSFFEAVVYPCRSVLRDGLFDTLARLQRQLKERSSGLSLGL